MSSVSKICSSAYNFVKSTVKAHPVATAACLVGTATVAGAIGYSVHQSKKRQHEVLNHFLLMNPILNPLGFVHHMNPYDSKITKFDNPLLIPIIEKNNKAFEDYYSKLTPQQKVQEFYNNGGKGVNFDAKA